MTSLTPKDVYFHTTKADIVTYLHSIRMEVIAFRQPWTNETFLSAHYGNSILIQGKEHIIVEGPRLILKPV